MPKRAKIITDFREFPESDLSDAVNLIINSLKVNANDFAELLIDISTLKSPLKKFNKKRNSIPYVGKSADVKRARRVLQKNLSSIGSRINDFTQGNVSLLNKSGFPFHQKSKAQGILPKTVLTMTSIKRTGKLKFAISKIKLQNIRYGLMYTLADNPEKNPAKWRFYYCSKKDGIIPNLESGKEYKFASFAMGSDIRLIYSNPVFMSAQ